MFSVSSKSVCVTVKFLMFFVFGESKDQIPLAFTTLQYCQQCKLSVLRKTVREFFFQINGNTPVVLFEYYL